MMNNVHKLITEFKDQAVVIAQYLQRSHLSGNAQTHERFTETVDGETALPFEQIPKLNLLNMVKHILSGSKYDLDLFNLNLALRDDYGDIFMTPALFGRKPILTTHNPKDFEQIFRNEGIWPNRPGSEVLHYYREKHRADFFQGVEGLISSQGQTWGHFRSVVNPVLMQPKNVLNYLQSISQVNMEFIECIKRIRDLETQEMPTDFINYINRWTLESISVVALDKQLGLLKENCVNSEAELLFKSLNDFFQYTIDMEVKLSPWRYITTPKLKKFLKVCDDIKDITSSFVNESMVRLESKSQQDIRSGSNEQSVLEKLLKTDQKIAIVMAMDMLMAGVETTSSAFVAAFLCLAKNPEKQMKLREEIFRLLPEKNSDFDKDSFRNAPYLRACIKESMRVYPLIVGNARVIENNCVLSGYQVPKGTVVSMIPLTVLNNSKYFAHADKYLPERWLRHADCNYTTSQYTGDEFKCKEPFAFLPFGFGPRMCVGKRVVDMELEVGIARIIRNFNVEFNYSTENAFKTVLLRVPNIPLRFKFTDV